MSIALENNRVEPNNGGFMHRNKKMSPFNLSPILDSSKDRTVIRMVVKEERENGYLDPSCSSSSSSSIGMNSDDDNKQQNDDDDDDDEQEEVQSKLKINHTFDSAVDALEQALPIRKGISKFYNGKSKSFASLTHATCSSIKEITKPENAYSRKRKNLLAYNLFYDRGRTSLTKSPGIEGGIAKRPTNSSRSTLALAVAMNNCEKTPSNDVNGDVSESNGRNNARDPSPCSPLLPPPWRSFSLVDLQHCAVSASSVSSNLSSPLMGKRTKTDEVS